MDISHWKVCWNTVHQQSEEAKCDVSILLYQFEENFIILMYVSQCLTQCL